MAKLDPKKVRQLMADNEWNLPQAVSYLQGKTLPENADDDSRGSRLERAILLAFAKGVLPSIIAGEVDSSVEEILEKVSENGKEVERLADIVGSDYQEIRLNCISDALISKMERVALADNTTTKEAMDLMEKVVKWRKDGDLEKVFSNGALEDTFENVPEDIENLDEQIEKRKARLRERGLNV